MLKVALFTSRNKDNKQLDHFKKRSMSFLTNKSPDELLDKFQQFVDSGQEGELSRFYLSVNQRDSKKLNKSLLHFLIDHEDYDLSKLDNKLTSLAAQPENALESKWLFDYDEKGEYLDEFLKDLESYLPSNVEVHCSKTPNGYAVVAGQGFDSRELLEKWKNVELKRDAMLCMDWQSKGSG